MTALPSGTVTMLFSDMEASTLLLSRLGDLYVEALSSYRSLLRDAWDRWHGQEMGTEGDSFFVVFETAADAVRAAVQAQQGLAAHGWPDGVPMRVRMGLHTGSPAPHDGGYVGMDVHRAARIAAAANGGQVVVSEATAGLVGPGVVAGVHLVDLGSHQLKDLPAPEHLFQLAGEGLPRDFPPLRSLGAATGLPVPATTLVGRDTELAELEALARSPGVRLVTLTGTGGSGKTRLAIALAQRLTSAYPDGVYFVPLAAATTADAMWTSLATTLDVPAADRAPPRLFDHLVHRSAVFVLDNLEQVAGADVVVSELVTRCPHIVAVATSRRPLHVAAEHEYAVPPLDLPLTSDVEAAERSAAVQLFVQHARKVSSRFALTADNAADVSAVCRRLDGLPLAIELAAARTRLLTPTALLARLGDLLELGDSGVDRPTRHQTLRSTLTWSHDLLTPALQQSFRRLGVFSGGADLDAVAVLVVPSGSGAGAGPGAAGSETLQVVSDLVEASLCTVSEAVDSEPRIGMLETVRAYALDQLRVHGELDLAQERHAHHYLHFAEQLAPLVGGNQQLAARARFETEHENLRDALRWSFRPVANGTDPDERIVLGLRLCMALALLWHVGGYFSERRRWLELGVERAGDGDRPELARCLSLLAATLRVAGDLESARGHATASVDMWRRMGDSSTLAMALTELADVEAERGDLGVARSWYEAAVGVARDSADRAQLRVVLGEFAILEASEGHHDQSLELDLEALSIARDLGDPIGALTTEHNLACTLREMGRLGDALAQMRNLVPRGLDVAGPGALTALAEDYAAILAEVGEHLTAVRLLGAADTMRLRLGSPRHHVQAAEIAGPIAETRAGLSAQAWDQAYQAGRALTIESALREAHAGDASRQPTPAPQGLAE
ncbi:MAG: adenylate/guanylate cyclase domain-containing protein [Nocardioidaceae bacterium]